MIVEEDTVFRRYSGRARLVTIAFLVLAVIVLIVGIVLISVAASKMSDEKSSGATPKQEGGGKPAPPNTCNFSAEAQRVGLPEFLDRVKTAYYKLHPYAVYLDPDVTTDKVKMVYVAYDPTPSVIKNRTDTALALLKEINGKEANTNAMKPRERKALAQVKHYLQHMFGQPYDVNYYAGDWMMGPNLFCWQEICDHGYGVYNGLGKHHKPFSAEDVKLIETKLQTHKAGILQYIENMRMGVRRGMIRSVEECEAGINSIKRQYLNISLHNETGEVDVLENCVIVVHNFIVYEINYFTHFFRVFNLFSF